MFQVLFQAGALLKHQLTHRIIQAVLWCRILSEPDYLDHQSCLELLELGHHDDLIEVGIFGQKLHAELLQSRRQVEAMNVAKQG